MQREQPLSLHVEIPDEPIVSFLVGLGYAPWYFVDGQLTSVRPCWPLSVLFIA